MDHDFNQSKGSKTILITCINCQKTQDSQGNWHKRNEYLADYEEVLLGFTLCHECALIHHSEFYKGIQKTDGAR